MRVHVAFYDRHLKFVIPFFVCTGTLRVLSAPTGQSSSPTAMPAPTHCSWVQIENPQGQTPVTDWVGEREFNLLILDLPLRIRPAR